MAVNERFCGGRLKHGDWWIYWFHLTFALTSFRLSTKFQLRLDLERTSTFNSILLRRLHLTFNVTLVHFYVTSALLESQWNSIPLRQRWCQGPINSSIFNTQPRSSRWRSKMVRLTNERLKNFFCLGHLQGLCKQRLTKNTVEGVHDWDAVVIFSSIW